MVSVVHFARVKVSELMLDERPVGYISAFLATNSSNDDPTALARNSDLSFQGSNIDGQGFVFSEEDESTHPVSEMHRILEVNPVSSEVIQPYLGGEELNATPDLTPSRYVIRLGNRDLDECEREWPELVQLVRSSVLPFREKRADNPQSRRLKQIWWRWHTERPSLYAAIEGRDRVLVNSQVSSTLAFAFEPTSIVFAVTLNVFALSTYASFCALQSRPHEIWARFFGSSMKDDLRYTPSDCFETFPFPESWKTHPALEAAGRAYYEFRAALMIRYDQGLTKTYHHFHDPDERDSEVVKLRELHAVMDRAVLDAYGWSDLSPRLDFILDYEDTEDEDNPGGRDRKKPWRYRWIDEDRDEVLARLLELNRTRAEEQAQSAAGTTAPRAAGKRGRKSSKRAPVASPNLFEVQEPTE